MEELYILEKIKPFEELYVQDIEYLNEAIFEAEKSLFISNRRLGACLKINSKHIIKGENQHREMAGRKFEISLHAEMNVLFKGIKLLEKKNKFNCTTTRLKDSIIYVVRLMKERRRDNFPKYYLGNSKPCNNCQRYLWLHNIKKIKYTDIIDGINVLCELKKNKL